MAGRMNSFHDVRFQLFLLFEYETLNPFVRELYELVVGRVERAGVAGSEFHDVLSDFLALEIEHYQHISLFVVDD